MKKSLFLSLVLAFFAIIPIGAGAQANDFSHNITLKPGWNVFSVPRVVETHQFSIAENNFDVYALDATKPSGWATMAELGQAEFTPLYGYFINNKTSVSQSLIVNYKQTITPDKRMFMRALKKGWNVLGVANPMYAIRQKEGDVIDRNNVNPILSSLDNNFNVVLDFAASSTNKSSVAISDIWNVKTSNEVGLIDDFRETKAYGVYLKNDSYYSGYQDINPVKTGDRVRIEFSQNGFTSAFKNEKGIPLLDFKVYSGYSFSATTKNLNVNLYGNSLNAGDFENMRLVCGGDLKYTVANPIIGDNLINTTVDFSSGETDCQVLVDVSGTISGEEYLYTRIPNANDKNVWVFNGNEFASGSTGEVSGKSIRIVSSNFALDGFAGNYYSVKPGAENINLGSLMLRSQDSRYHLDGFTIGIEAENEEITESGFNYIENLRIVFDGRSYPLNFSGTSSDNVATYSVANINSQSMSSFDYPYLRLYFDAKDSATNQSYQIKISNADSVFVLKTEDWRNYEGVDIQPKTLTLGKVSIVKPVPGRLFLESNGVVNPVDVGAGSAVLAKFKISAGPEENVKINSIALKKAAGSATDTSFENFGLYSGGSLVAVSSGIVNGFVNFTIPNNFIVNNGNARYFELRARVIDGFGKNIKFNIDKISDVVAVGENSNSAPIITNDFSGSLVEIKPISIALSKDNAYIDKVRADYSDVVLGTIKITLTAGNAIELESLKITINTSTSSTSNLKNVEFMDKSTGNVYDLTLIDGQYSNFSLDFDIPTGVTKELVVRADVDAAADNGITYTLFVDANDLIFKDMDENVISEKTPSSLSFNPVTVQSPALTISTNALSSSLNAVVGTSNIQVISFNLRANQTEALKVTELKIADVSSSDVNSRVIYRFNLYKDGDASTIRAINGSQISNQTVTFNGLNITVPKGEAVKYYATIDLVGDSSESGTTTQWEVVGYTAEDQTMGRIVYDNVNDPNSDGVITTNVLRSARVVTVLGSGSLVVEMDNSNTDTLKDKYEIAGGSTGMLAAIKLRATNENVKIQDLNLAVLDSAYATSTIANSIFSALQIIDTDKVTVLKEISNVTGSTLIQGLNLVVPMSSKTIYIKGILNPIGKDLVGVNNAAVKFAVNGNGSVIKGESSSAILTPTGTTAACSASQACIVNSTGATVLMTNVSKETGILASKISSVELVANGGGISVSSALSTGINNIAIIKVTTDNTANTLSNGDELKTIINTFRLNISDAGITAAASNAFSIERVGGINSVVSVSTTTETGVVAKFDVSGWTDDNKLDKQTTAYYVVKVNLVGISAVAGGASIQVDLNDLNGTTATTNNFAWQDSSDAGVKYPLRLSTNKVSGIKITN